MNNIYSNSHNFMSRDTRIDFYKGLLMWGVVWGHTITALLCNDPNHNKIHSLFRLYDMPFFMLISGFFLSLSVNKYKLKFLLLNKITTILFPTIMWSLISSKLTSISGYYFLWAVFLSSYICILVHKLITSSSIKLAIFLIVILCLHLQPYRIWNMPFLFPYFVLGFYGKLVYSKYRMYVLPLFVLGFCFWDTSYSVWNAGCYLFSKENILMIILFRTFMAILGILLAKRVMDVIYNTVSIENTRFYRLMVNSGRETLAIYILQAIIVENFLGRVCSFFVSRFGFNIFNISETVLGYVYAPIISIIVILLLFRLIEWMKNNPYLKNLFGFKI